MDGKSVRAMRPKNKAPAPIQITAEQLLREASERVEDAPRPVRRRIADSEEASELRQLKRKNFEDKIRRNRGHVGNWLAYATYEEGLQEYARVRSLYERALEIDPRNITLWLKYAEFEMRHKKVNLARNVWNRAVTLLPFVEQFWYKFAYMEELLGNIDGARTIFDRWLAWDPPETAWSSYIKLECRYKEHARARYIFANLVTAYPSTKNYIKWALFEGTQVADQTAARQVYELAAERLSATAKEARLYKVFAGFEARLGEIDRARAVFRLGLEQLPPEKAAILEKQFLAFERQFGSDHGLQEALLFKKRQADYEQQLAHNPFIYDTWFDYALMQEASLREGTGAALDSVRAVYEAAVSHTPPVAEKTAWSRYIYLWIAYAVFEELVAGDTDRAKAVYQRITSSIPHATFTFAKVWELHAAFLVRLGDLQGARKLLGRSLGMCPKRKLFRAYLSLEEKLKEFTRMRTLFTKWVLFDPADVCPWADFVSFEQALGEVDRVAALLSLSRQCVSAASYGRISQLAATGHPHSPL